MSMSDIGVSRKDNQDNYWSALLEINGKECGVICVCDGMGGLNNGGIASRIVVELVRDCIKEGCPFEDIGYVISNANSIIYEIGKKEEKPMGTTCTVLKLCDGGYKIFHVGDSRCYKLDARDNCKLLTTDHSALNKYNITKEKDEKLWRKYKNLLTRCVGIKADVSVDFYEGTYQDGDMFLVCSDGMWHYFDEHIMVREKLLNLPELIKSCMSCGETDNITGSLLIV